MVILSKRFDERIKSWNLYIETSFGKYLSFAGSIIANNDLQRKRVRSSKTVYSLLKNDLKQGCVMPPLVLAITGTNDIDCENVDNVTLVEQINTIIENNPERVLILDGLQRTYTLIDAFSEVEKTEPETLKEFEEYKLRLEVYININKFGVLYRMLTLNTGQTPMAVRHQLEMLYRDMLETKVDGITLVTDNDGTANPDDGEFEFKNVIDGFNSYMNRNELPVDRQEMLDNIQMLENMSAEDIHNDIFEEFLRVYAKVFNKICEISGQYNLTESDRVEYGISDSPFGKKVSKVFSTSQAMTGFGAALGRMKDNEIIKDIDEVEKRLQNLASDSNEWFLEMLVKFDNIKSTAKKIGNAQRMFFQYFFRELMNPECDSYLDLCSAVKNGYKKYITQV